MKNGSQWVRLHTSNATGRRLRPGRRPALLDEGEKPDAEEWSIWERCMILLDPVLAFGESSCFRSLHHQMVYHRSDVKMGLKKKRKMNELMVDGRGSKDRCIRSHPTGIESWRICNVYIFELRLAADISSTRSMPVLERDMMSFTIDIAIPVDSKRAEIRLKASGMQHVTLYRSPFWRDEKSLPSNNNDQHKNGTACLTIHCDPRSLQTLYTSPRCSANRCPVVSAIFLAHPISRHTSFFFFFF